MKILAPAGNFDCLKTAIANGADEVYLGVNRFNARNNVDGFTIETLKDAVTYAHIFGVRVHLAVNVLFSDEEIQSALDLIVNAFNFGVDAFIIQDLGLISLVHKYYPQIEIHASTQMAVHNLEGVRFLSKYGVKRVVLARETPLSEIKRIRQNSDIEIEYFSQGALCVSFSGNCYLSSYLFNASGNRGVCKQPCRLPFTLKLKDKQIKKGYLLSCKDFNMSGRLKELKEAGVTAIKIEGRARRPYYVGVATREYYKAINGSTPDQTALSLAFNRGFTEGYFNGNGRVISDVQNHVGVECGKVNKVVGGKTFNEVFFYSNITLSPKSTFKIFSNGIEKSTLTAFDLKLVSNGNYRLTTTQKVDKGDMVRLILDYQKEKELLEITPKKQIRIDIFATIDKPITANVYIDDKIITTQGEILLSADNSPLSEEEIIKNFTKSEYYMPIINVCALDRVFIRKKDLNEFRRYTYEQVYKAIENTDRHLTHTTLNLTKKTKPLLSFEFVNNFDDKVLSNNVIYSPDEYILEDIIDLNNKYTSIGKNFYLSTPNFALEKDIAILTDIVKKTGCGVVANNYYALNLCDKIIVGAPLNVYNNFTANELNLPFITAEIDLGSRIDFAYMTLRHCPMKAHLNGNCNNCPYQDGFTYTMDNGKVLKLKRKKLSTCTFYLTD